MFLRKQLGAGLKDIRPAGSDRCGHRCRRPRLRQYRIRCYKLPPLKDCRELFSESLGQPVDWGAKEWTSENWQKGDSWNSTFGR